MGYATNVRTTEVCLAIFQMGSVSSMSQLILANVDVVLILWEQIVRLLILTISVIQNADFTGNVNTANAIALKDSKESTATSQIPH